MSILDQISELGNKIDDAAIKHRNLQDENSRLMAENKHLWNELERYKQGSKKELIS